MDLLDANILIGAFRPDDPDHAILKSWLEESFNEGLFVKFPPLVEAAFLRIVTHPRIFSVPSPLEAALGFLRTIHESGLFQETAWTSRARSRWQRWCRELGMQGLGMHGNDINDAYLAATAAEAHCRLVSRDAGFSRFPGLKWWNPAAEEV